MPTATTNSNFENDIDHSDILLVTGAQCKIASRECLQIVDRRWAWALVTVTLCNLHLISSNDEVTYIRKIPKQRSSCTEGMEVAVGAEVNLELQLEP